ncbi:DEAD/DEAH box helicase [Serinicoccus profundi]|uniref:DEAD/DEAH box helicase n=1 Tax=Serinicoccus profundi TaxID=1078471 RepID=UPI000255E38D|nr:DEAD/DEAH box helicase [Serinicoccus profundi]
MAGPPRAFVAPDWIHDLHRDDLSRVFGTTTVKRAVTYQRQGAVQHLRQDLDGVLTATVYGNRPYSTSVWTPDAPRHQTQRGPVGLETDCSCPVGTLCKHAAALILHAQRTSDATRPASPTRPAPTPAPHPTWESLLAPVLAELDPAVEDRGGTPLALQVELAQATTAHPTRLRLKPLTRGASGAWIQTGISWSDLHRGYGGQRGHAEHRAALGAIVQAHAARAPHWYHPGEWVESAALGPAIWPLLREAARCGVALVTGRGRRPVQLADPVDLSLDLTRGPDGIITLDTVVDLPGATAAPQLLGYPGHGLAAGDEHGMVLAPLSRPLSKAVTTLLGRAGQLRVPPADTERFLTTYSPALRRHTTLISSDSSVLVPEVRPPRLGLTVTFEPEHVTRLRWTFRYAVGQVAHEVPLRPAPGIGHGPARAGQARSAGDGPGAAATPVVRDLDREEALLASLDVLDAAPGLRIPLPGKTRLGVVLEPELTGWATVQFVRDVLPALHGRGDIDVTVVGEPLAYAEVEDGPVVQVSTRDLGHPESDGNHDAEGVEIVADRDWFGLGVTIRAGDQEVPLRDLVTALTHDEEHLLLPDGSWFRLDTDELRSLHRVIQEARTLDDGGDGDDLRINRYQAGLWEELVSLGVVTEQSERWQRTVGALLALEELPHPDPPATVEATLRDYQLDGYRWLSFLLDHELGGILADDMGLGKTLQVLTAAERSRVEGRLTPQEPLLVVAPTSVVATWEREAARFTPGLRVAALTQTLRRAGQTLNDLVAGHHVVVTSYTLLRIDEADLLQRTWGAVVLDEAQAVKNHRSRTYQVARRLRAPVKIAVTGTPLENSLMDLWALLSIVAPGLFSSPERFGTVFRKPIESGAAPEQLETLRRRIRPLVLRRTKEAVAADLPAKVEQVISVPLNPAHRRIYDTHLQRERQRILGLLDDVDRHRIAILAALTKLRQLSLDVHLVVPDAPATARPSKVDALLEHVVEVAAEGHRCLVFSQFTRFLRVVRERLEAEGIEHVYLDGRTRDRPRRIAQFTDGDAPVFLISLKAGGSGLTLTEADYVFVLDPWWNPAVEAQAVDRTHRIGQDKTVMVYRLVAEGTIEEKVVELQEHKRELFDKVVDAGGALGAPLSAEDIRGLLGPTTDAPRS